MDVVLTLVFLVGLGVLAMVAGADTRDGRDWQRRDETLWRWR